MQNADSFFKCYSPNFRDANVRVIEIGSQDVNGSIRSVCPANFEYVGVDFCDARGVDVVLKDPYSLPFDAESADIFVSSSCFEHSEFFWLVFMEVMRCLKPHGLFYLNAPSTGPFHRYPVDCWRFYPDSGAALVNWGRRNGLTPTLLESYTQIGGQWEDHVAVFLKDEGFAASYPARIIDTKADYENGLIHGDPNLRNARAPTQAERRLRVIQGVANGSIAVK